jgi:hypothetical protein
MRQDVDFGMTFEALLYFIILTTGTVLLKDMFIKLTQ